MTTKWGRMRSQATEAGCAHAYGGEDRRAEFASRGPDVRDAYDSGYRNAQRDIAEQQEREDRLAPLRDISRRAIGVRERSNYPEVVELGELIEQLADYLISKEES